MVLMSVSHQFVSASRTITLATSLIINSTLSQIATRLRDSLSYPAELGLKQKGTGITGRHVGRTDKVVRYKAFPNRV